MTELARRVVTACLEYDFWAAEVAELTDAISGCWCPKEGNDRERQPSCYRRATRRDWSKLDAIREQVAGCASCVQLCDLVARRKHARKRLGVAKRAVHAAARKIINEGGIRE